MHRYTARARVCARTREERGGSVRRLTRVRKSREPHTLVERVFFPLSLSFYCSTSCLRAAFPGQTRWKSGGGGGGRYPSSLDGPPRNRLFLLFQSFSPSRFYGLFFFFFKRNFFLFLFFLRKQKFLKIFRGGFIISFVINEIFFSFSNWISLFLTIENIYIIWN